jgi:chromosome segregation ATPase
MTKAQEVYERVEALVAAGARKADAFRQVAEEFEQPMNSMRGAYYAHTRTLGQATPRTRKKIVVIDPVEQARTVLTTAIESIDEEIADAKARIDEAKADYEQLRDTAQERKASLKAKLDALSA